MVVAQPFAIEHVTAQRPLGPGTVWQTFDAPVINELGQIGFAGVAAGAGVTTENDQGVWFGRYGQVQPVAREGMAVESADPPQVWRTNPAFFVEMMRGDALAYSGSFEPPPGGIRAGNFIVTPARQQIQVLQTGDHAPGTSAGTIFTSRAAVVATTPTGLRNSFFGSLGGPDVDDTNNVGLWANNIVGPTQLIARLGQQAPGLPAGATFGNLDYPCMNAAGSTLFRAAFNVGSGGVTAGNNTSYWRYDSGAAAMILREGQALGGGVNIGDINANTAIINSAGDFAFPTNLTGSVTGANDAAIIKQTSAGVTSIVARKGSAAPGGGTFTTFNTGPDATDNGRVVFRAVTTANNTGIFMSDGSTITRIASNSTPVPSKPGAVFSMIRTPITSPTGQVAFLADLSTSGDVTFGHLFATDPLGTVHYIAGPGTMIETFPGITQQVLRAKISEFQEAERSQFNAAGQLVFTADFVGGGSGIFLVTVPEPSAGAIIAALLLPLWARRGRARLPLHG